MSKEPAITSVVIVLSTILAAGIAIGILLERGVLSRSKSSHHHFRPPPHEERLLEILTERLELSEEQISSIAPILREMLDEGHQTFEELKPVLEAQVEAGRVRIRLLLSAEQTTRFDALNREFDHQRKRRGRKHKGPRFRGPPPPGMPMGPPPGPRRH